MPPESFFDAKELEEMTEKDEGFRRAFVKRSVLFKGLILAGLANFWCFVFFFAFLK